MSTWNNPGKTWDKLGMDAGEPLGKILLSALSGLGGGWQGVLGGLLGGGIGLGINKKEEKPQDFAAVYDEFKKKQEEEVERKIRNAGLLAHALGNSPADPVKPMGGFNVPGGNPFGGRSEVLMADSTGLGLQSLGAVLSDMIQRRSAETQAEKDRVARAKELQDARDWQQKLIDEQNAQTAAGVRSVAGASGLVGPGRMDWLANADDAEVAGLAPMIPQLYGILKEKQGSQDLAQLGNIESQIPDSFWADNLIDRGEGKQMYDWIDKNVSNPRVAALARGKIDTWMGDYLKNKSEQLGIQQAEQSISQNEQKFPYELQNLQDAHDSTILNQSATRQEMEQRGITFDETQLDRTYSQIDSNHFDRVLSETLNSFGTIPYKFGGTGKSGIDCSAFTQQFMSKLGINIPRTSAEQAQVGTPIGDTKDLKPGDLVFYDYDTGTGARGAGIVDHVAVYMGNGMIAQSGGTTKGVGAKPLEDGHIIAMRRVLPDREAVPGKFDPNIVAQTMTVMKKENLTLEDIKAYVGLPVESGGITVEDYNEIGKRKGGPDFIPIDNGNNPVQENPATEQPSDETDWRESFLDAWVNDYPLPFNIEDMSKEQRDNLKAYARWASNLTITGLTHHKRMIDLIRALV